MKNGIKCSYVLVNAVSYIMKEVCYLSHESGIALKFLYM